MNKYQVHENQSLLDVSILLTGIAKNAIIIAQFNGLNPSEKLKAGIELEIPNNLEIDIQIQKYYSLNEIRLATALSEESIRIITGCEGIGCWAIGIDFEIS